MKCLSCESGVESRRSADKGRALRGLFGGETPEDFAALVREARDIAGALGAELDAGHVAVLAALWWRLGPLDRTRPPLAARADAEEA